MSETSGPVYMRRNQQVGNEATEPAEITSRVPQGTVPGRTLFMIYINGIVENIKSHNRLFSDNCVVYREFDSPIDHLILQQELNNLTV